MFTSNDSPRVVTGFTHDGNGVLTVAMCDRFKIETAILSKMQEESTKESTTIFTTHLQKQAERVVDFLESEQKNHEMLAKAVLKSLVQGTEQPENALVKADKLASSFRHIEEYVGSMIRSLAKIAVQADKKLNTASFQLVKRELERASFSSAFFVVLSDIYETNRVTQKNQAETSKWVAPASFERETTKYWYVQYGVKLLMSLRIETKRL